MGYDLCNPYSGGGGGGGSTVEGLITFTDVGAKALGLPIPAGATVVRAEVNVLILFDGTTPRLTIGDAAQHDRLMPDTENDLSQVAMNISECGNKYMLATQVSTYLTIGGAPTQGQALVIVQFVTP